LTLADDDEQKKKRRKKCTAAAREEDGRRGFAEQLRRREEHFGKTGDGWKREKKKTKTHSLDANGRPVKTRVKPVW
jgi:hypothetical protein